MRSILFVSDEQNILNAPQNILTNVIVVSISRELLEKIYNLIEV